MMVRTIKELRLQLPKTLSRDTILEFLHWFSNVYEVFVPYNYDKAHTGWGYLIFRDPYVAREFWVEYQNGLTIDGENVAVFYTERSDAEKERMDAAEVEIEDG